MAAHEFEPYQLEEDKISSFACKVCGYNYHCPQCEDGCSAMGHQARDEEGLFFSCQEPERFQAMLEVAFERHLGNFE